MLYTGNGLTQTSEVLGTCFDENLYSADSDILLFLFLMTNILSRLGQKRHLNATLNVNVTKRGGGGGGGGGEKEGGVAVSAFEESPGCRCSQP